MLLLFCKYKTVALSFSTMSILYRKNVHVNKVNYNFDNFLNIFQTLQNTSSD